MRLIAALVGSALAGVALPLKAEQSGRPSDTSALVDFLRQIEPNQSQFGAEGGVAMTGRPPRNCEFTNSYDALLGFVERTDIERPRLAAAEAAPPRDTNHEAFFALREFVDQLGREQADHPEFQVAAAESKATAAKPKPAKAVPATTTRRRR